MKRKRLVLFDIDGTILNGGKLWRECLEGAFRFFHPGTPVPKVSYSGKTDRQICREVLESMGETSRATEDGVDRILDEYLSRVHASLAAGRSLEVAVLPGVREALARLRVEPSVHLGLLTGNVREGARLKLGAVGLEGYFAGCIGAFGDDHWDRYELPRIAVDRAHRELGLHYQGKEVVIVGDTIHDVNCGKSIGVRAIGVATGRPEHRELILNANPDFFFESLENVDRLLEAVLIDL